MKYTYCISYTISGSSLCRSARVRRREGEKRLIGLEDATSTPLERQIREEGEAAEGDEEGDVSRDVVRNDDTIIFTLLPGAIVPGILPRCSSDTHTRIRASKRARRARANDHRHAAKRINSRTYVRVITARGHNEAAHTR